MQLQPTRRFGKLIVVILLQLLSILLVVFHPSSAGSREGNLVVDFLDVGQGDSALITLPEATTILVDGGGRPGPFKSSRDEAEQHFEPDSRSIGEAVVSEYLWWRGLDQIDYIVATHADADHIDGLNDIARNFAVRAALVAHAPTNDPEYLEFTNILETRGIPIRQIAAGDRLSFNNSYVEVLWPLASSAHRSGNNESLVLQLRYGERTILLTGDIEAAAENGLLQTTPNLATDVVKVPHHGSKTSSTQAFVTATSPRFAVISVGQTSVFGHPNKEVVERWQTAGAKVLTTGNSGTLTVITDVHQLQFNNFAHGP